MFGHVEFEKPMGNPKWRHSVQDRSESQAKERNLGQKNTYFRTSKLVVGHSCKYSHVRGTYRMSEMQNY